MENIKTNQGDLKVRSKTNSQGRVKRSGVYAITHVPSGRRYIGGSLDCVNRFGFHRWALRRGVHSCKELQALWTSGAECDFTFNILTVVSHDQDAVRAAEQVTLTSEPGDTLLNQSRRWQGSTPEPSDARKAAARKLWERPGYRVDFLNQRDERGQFSGG